MVKEIGGPGVARLRHGGLAGRVAAHGYNVSYAEVLECNYSAFAVQLRYARQILAPGVALQVCTQGVQLLCPAGSRSIWWKLLEDHPRHDSEFCWSRLVVGFIDQSVAAANACIFRYRISRKKIAAKKNELRIISLICAALSPRHTKKKTFIFFSFSTTSAR